MFNSLWNRLALWAACSVLVLTGCQVWGEPDPSPPNNAPEGVEFDDPIEVDRGDAFVGPWRMNESEFHYIDDPTVALGDDGRIAADNSHFREGDRSRVVLIVGQ